jgi:MoaA/NifB/PqqE/SkfB family radical SAM enzyme
LGQAVSKGFNGIELLVEINSECNLNCTICSSSNSNTYIELAELIKIIKIIYGAKKLIDVVCLSGGEPLLHKHILEICELVKINGYKLYVYTCGNIGKGPIPDNMLLSLKKLSIDKLIYSIHGSNSSMHDKITRTAGSYYNLISSIKTSISIGIETELHIVPILDNYKDIFNILTVAQELKIKSSILRLVKHGNALGMRGVSDKVVIDEISKCSGSIRIGAPYDNILHCKSGCNINNKLVILPNGDVYPCVSLKHNPNYILGNIYKSSIVDMIEHLPIDQYSCLEEEFVPSIRGTSGFGSSGK